MCAHGGAVAAVLTARAIGDRLECIFVNNGLLRLNEAEQVLEQYKALNLKVHYVDATDVFLGALAGLVAGSLVAALFLRWPWWVGVGALAVTLWVLPVVVASVPPLEAAASAVAAWPWSPGAGAVLLAAAHWLVMRRMPVP